MERSRRLKTRHAATPAHVAGPMLDARTQPAIAPTVMPYAAAQFRSNMPKLRRGQA